MRRLLGPVISSYTVSDRTQVADLDPFLLIEEFDDQPCPVCGDHGNEDRLLPCDGCGDEYHTYCVNLPGIPARQWFCESCSTQLTIDTICPDPLRRHNTGDWRTRGQRRRAIVRNQISSSSWARVWQSVWDRLNLDLDFPFDEGSNGSRNGETRQTRQERREFRQWERRLQVAERQGAANRFRDTASTFSDLRAPRGRVSLPESESESNEEIRAWNALEKANEIQRDPLLNHRKRRSSDSSPSDQEPALQQERPLKRPRTRRAIDLGESSDDAQPAASAGAPLTRKPTNPQRSDVDGNTTGGSGPTFLQSLLNEVESSAAPDEPRGNFRSSFRPDFRSLTRLPGHSSPQFRSAGLSPTSSDHGSPRALSRTPPLFPYHGPGSLCGLTTSRVEPILPPPEHPPGRVGLPYTPHRTSPGSDTYLNAYHINRLWRSPNCSPEPPCKNLSRSEETSPTRLNLSLSTKSDVQKTVSAALNPYFKSNTVSKDQYTDINRTICRMMYEKLGETGDINGDAKEMWELLARNEVAKAVSSLESNSSYGSRMQAI